MWRRPVPTYRPARLDGVGRRPRVIPLQVLPDGSYVMAGGTLVSETVRLAKEADGTPHLELTGIETVRRTTGL